MRHGHMNTLHVPTPGSGGAGAEPPDRVIDDLMSLEDFLAESEKTPNRVSPKALTAAGSSVMCMTK